MEDDIMKYEEQLMTKIAWYYYMEKMTQQKISELLGISRIRVIKLLEKAQAVGIIRFSISGSGESYMKLHNDLTEKYLLNDTVIVPSSPDSEKNTASAAKAAAQYIRDRIGENALINIGYGQSAALTVSELSKKCDKSVSCVSLTGGVNNYLTDSSRNINLHLIPAPLLASSPKTVCALKEERAVSEIYRLAAVSEMSVIGIGAPNENATLFKSGILAPNDLVGIKSQGAAGDILGHFLRADGSEISLEFDDRLISMPLETLRGYKNVIAVATGKDKTDAIRAALLTGAVDILVTDEETAELL